ncbi:MAG: hypothetical protein ABI779_13070 [Acidobacteriota bacterium]
MKKNVPALLLLLLAPALLAQDAGGRFDAATRYTEPEIHAPANVSRMFTRTLSRSGAIDLPATGSGSMIIWTLNSDRATRVKTRLLTPSGQVLQPADRGSLDRGLRRFEIGSAEASELGLPGAGAQEVVHVLSTVGARYQLEVDVPPSGRGATVVAAEPESPLTLSTWAAPLSRQPGQPVTLHAELRDGDDAISGATLTARLASPSGKAFDTIALTDRGHGIYEATVADLPENAAGAWQVRFEAEGVTTSGARFARTGAGELVAERGAARLGLIHTEVLSGVLRLTVPADVALAGNYRLDVIVADDAHNGLAWAEGARTLPTGRTALTIDIPLTHLGDTPIDQLFLDVRLLGLDPIGVAGRATLRMQ